MRRRFSYDFVSRLTELAEQARSLRNLPVKIRNASGRRKSDVRNTSVGQKCEPEHLARGGKDLAGRSIEAAGLRELGPAAATSAESRRQRRHELTGRDAHIRGP